jgi:DNA-binding NarL/FixJ family response regulator
MRKTWPYYRMPNMNGVDMTKYLRMRFPVAIIIGVSSDDKRERIFSRRERMFSC